jgi:peptidoglycan hydrolase-like protein with peptidoglycan-binding domain
MPADSLQSSVGRGGTNRAADVAIVQRLLLARGFARLGDADGVCGKNTIEAIVDFQKGFLRRPDGRIDPGGASWRALAGTYSGVGTTTAPDSAPAPSPGSLTRNVPRPAPESINQGLRPVSNRRMLELFGDPRGGDYSTQCQPPTLPRMRRNMVLDSVGPFRVTGLVPAVLSLKAVLIDVRAEQPAVYRALGTAGMLCCRWVRGSSTSISNHSWGTAIDLTLDGVLDVQGNDRVQYGLTLIAPIFNRHGWFWGAAFRTEDAMHFEASQSLVESWEPRLL